MGYSEVFSMEKVRKEVPITLDMEAMQEEIRALRELVNGLITVTNQQVAAVNQQLIAEIAGRGDKAFRSLNREAWEVACRRSAFFTRLASQRSGFLKKKLRTMREYLRELGHDLSQLKETRRDLKSACDKLRGQDDAVLREKVEVWGEKFKELDTLEKALDDEITTLLVDIKGVEKEIDEVDP